VDDDIQPHNMKEVKLDVAVNIVPVVKTKEDPNLTAGFHIKDKINQ
jgi:hypothetical protein